MATRLSRSERQTQTRAQLLEAAQRVFLRKGFHAEARRRFPPHTEAMLRAGSIEEGLRASAREMAGYAREHPGWTGVYVEFWTHASRRPELRRVAEQHERLLDTVGGLVEQWTARWDVEFRLPVREVARGIHAISRGMGLEAVLAEGRGPAGVEHFEEMFLAYAMGLLLARTTAAAPGRGGSHDVDRLSPVHLHRPPAGHGQRAARPGPLVARPAAPPARCTSPTRPTPCCRPAGPGGHGRPRGPGDPGGRGRARPAGGPGRPPGARCC